MKNHIKRGMAGGFLGALVMAALAYVGSFLGLVPMAMLEVPGRMFLGNSASLVQVLPASLATLLSMGTVVGSVFAALYQHGGIRNGLLFSMIPWGGMLVITFVIVQVGLISLNLTWLVAAVSLALHLVFGVMLGWWLKRPQPVAVFKHA